MIIGITGKACAGKDRYARVFAEFGAEVIDVDHLGHAALEANKEQILAHFGPSVEEAGVINRKALGAIVFANPTQLAALEAISHPWMVEHIKEMIARSEAELIIVNAALLTRMGLDHLCSHVLYIWAPRWVRYRRCTKRDCLSYQQFIQREKQQRDITYRNLSKATKNYRLWNWASAKTIYRQVQRCCVRIMFERCNRTK